MMNLEIRDIMNPSPVTICPTENIGELSFFMLNKGLTQLPVVENGKLVGMLTTFDLWKSYENRTTLSDLHVSDVMNTKVIKLAPKDKVGTAAELFADNRFKTLPVVNLDGTLKGTVTAFDLIKVAFNNEYDKAILYKDRFSSSSV